MTSVPLTVKQSYRSALGFDQFSPATITFHGDHVLSCNHFTEKKPPGHDLVVRVVSSLARVAGHDVSHDSRRPHHGHRAYSPNQWRPNLTCLFGTQNHTHILVDITCPSVVAAGVVQIHKTDAKTQQAGTECLVVWSIAGNGSVGPSDAANAESPSLSVGWTWWGCWGCARLP